MAMASHSNIHPLHFVLFPFMAQGHMIPLIDIAKLLAQRGAKVTVITTPLNAKRFEANLARAVQSGLQIHLIHLPFPAEEAGLPKDCENLDGLTSLGLGGEFWSATNRLQEPVEKLLQQLIPRPNCIISDRYLPYTAKVACKLGVPRIAFSVFSCFCMLCMQRIHTSRILENIKSESEYFAVPDLPDHVKINKQQLPQAFSDNMGHFSRQVYEAEMMTYGIIINSFEEMESEYVREYKKVRAGKVWCVGPVSLCNKDNFDKAERGDKASIQESEWMNFLESQNPASVIYVCFGSICNLVTGQLIELALGLEASNKPFIWVIRGKGKSKELENWIEETNFEERNKVKGIIIKGWAPQVVILSQPSIGGFLTHCGWNSSLEGIAAGLPMVTWPLFGDQFCNERLVVDVLRIGVKVGAEVTIKWGEEEKIGVSVRRENVRNAIKRVMDEGEESEERRRRAKELSKMAREAMEEKGSSYLNMKLLIEDIMQQQQEASLKHD